MSHHSSESHASDHHGEWKWLGDGSLRAQDAEEGLGHIVPISVFNKVFGALVVLTVITVAASRVDFGELNTIIAILIASVKAFLVAYFFMHLKFEGKIVIMYAIYPLILLFLLIGGSLGDIADREHPLPFWKEKADLLAKPAPDAHGDGHGAGHSESHNGESHNGESHNGESHNGEGHSGERHSGGSHGESGAGNNALSHGSNSPADTGKAKPESAPHSGQAEHSGHSNGH